MKAACQTRSLEGEGEKVLLELIALLAAAYRLRSALPQQTPG